MPKLRLFSGLIWLLLLLGLPAAQAQVVTTQPYFFRDDTPVTLTFDATQGNGGLANFTGPVYIWTGVVTNLSTSNTNWRYVKSPSFNQPDPAALMTRSATNPNLYTITLTPRTFYNVPAAEQILRLGMLFKDAAGNTIGRGDGGADIFVDVFQGGYAVRITSPVTGGNPQFVMAGATVTVSGAASASSRMEVYLNKALLSGQYGVTSISYSLPLTQVGRNVVRIQGNSGAQTVSDSVVFIVRSSDVPTAALPAGTKDGVTYLSSTSVRLKLTAPEKQFVYVLGDFNGWQPAQMMNRTPDGKDWWLDITGLAPGREYAYQFLVDGQLRIADPYTEKILSPTDDQYIPPVTYPNLKAYPTGLTTGNVAVLQTDQASYNWQVTNFQRPKKTDLVIYELLLRDFVAQHDYKTLRDTLSYLQRLGVNAIELLPFNEFEGNESWGYNPSFYFAPDKYYGTKTDLKRFIDECHRRGIAVVMDMVLNHSCGQSPMVQLYFNGNTGKPAANSPWFNQDATHPFNVCYDFNHESPYTKYFSKRVMEYWLQEYHIDGYRFDLSKGFTQKQSANVDEWNQYDQSRINIWQDYRNTITAVSADAFIILEHLGNNDEEKVLADLGLMLWGNMNGSYNEATMGYLGGSDFSGGYYGARTWTQPNLVTYMESHDEERLTFKNVAYGNSSGTYSVKDLNTALARDEMAAAFFFTVPGPKMVWQFGELGYDFSINRCTDGTINDNCRTANKPIRWDYQQVPARKQLYDVYRSLIALRVNEPVFEAPTTYTQQLAGAGKTIHLAGPGLNVTVVGNFDVVPTNVNPGFQQAGTWYNYLTGATRVVTDPNAAITLQPGEYAVYTSRRITRPGVLATKSAQQNLLHLSAAPNPADATATLRYELASAAPVSLAVTNLLGATVYTLPTTSRQAIGAHELALPTANLANGVYLVRLSAGSLQQTTRVLVRH
ncbi:alpha-amylase family glycosyl hydrolase [Hymenobacter sp. GOD-10R]|uniref:DUF4961 domain-containing protein n=1 Tax=Hymenobacter sp. GOD-10R TaxID=3093922 RepID=UPI002D775053|nr:alpha-amylase family glycosyl hydrolase [Hymenobacter sp. GOD-10R]WRQ26791.1 alpha-amylase family glycosyl hydrolase [Hymenobacter sp. GOD-10R]